MSYPTQEDELRAEEARAVELMKAEEERFLSIYQSVPRSDGGRLSHLANAIVTNFKKIMEESRGEPFERQEDIMAGMKKLFQEKINVIEARRQYAVKLNPSTAAMAASEPSDKH
ncbi:MAG TPA: hypothetical protein VNI77_10140 [Nitrososphaera sp.]|nr:hypothetical protein [Nitrososphaera sp.]